MVTCVWEDLGSDTKRCVNCHRSITTPHPVERIGPRRCTMLLLDEISRQVCAGCRSGQEELNRHLPGSGDVLARAINIATFGHGAQIGHLIHGGPRLLLRWPHGMGDAVQGTVVLRHLRELHPEWKIDCAAKWGQRSIFDGLADRTFHIDDHPPESEYEAATTLDWWDPEQTYCDSPSTKSERCLREVFRIQPIERLCRYEITPDADTESLIEEYAPRESFACVHYQGNSAFQNKNINEHAIREGVKYLIGRGLTVVLLDWDNRSGLLGMDGVINFPAGHPIWGGKHGTGEGANIAALVSRSVLNIGIDSGPGHIMGSVDVPGIIIWDKHHPINYYCLAPNIVHLIRPGHEQFIFGDQCTGVDYFYGHYRHHLSQKNLRLELPELIAKELDQC